MNLNPRLLRRITSVSVLQVTLAACLFRVIWLFFSKTNQISDFSDYVLRAKNFSGNHSLTNMGSPQFLRVPGWPVYLSTLSFGHLTRITVLIICALTSSSLVYFSSSLMKSLGFSSKSRILMAVLVAAFPPFIEFSSVAASEHLAILLLVIACTFYFSKETSSNWVNYVRGIMLSLPTFARPEYLFLTPILVYLLNRIRNQLESSRNMQSNVALMTRKIFFFQISGYLTLPLIWILLVHTKAGGNSFGITTALGCNLLMSVNPSRTYGYSALYAHYCDTFQGQSEAISIVMRTIISQPIILFESLFRGVSAFFNSPSNYGIDWGFTCWSKDFCASSFRGSWLHGQLAEDVLRAINGFLLIWLYLVTGFLAARAFYSNKQLNSKLIWASGYFLIAYLVYSVLLAPFNIRFRFLYDWVWLLIIVTFFEFGKLTNLIKK
jgi:hypothetical protein